MGNWIPGDPTFVSQLLKISSAFVPPPPEGFHKSGHLGSGSEGDRAVCAGRRVQRKDNDGQGYLPLQFAGQDSGGLY